MSATVGEATGDWTAKRYFVECDDCSWLTGLLSEAAAWAACEEHNAEHRSAA